MNSYDTADSRRFYRSPDKRVLGGVCGGLAEYFGFNLKVTRLLAVIALFMAPPFAIVSYLAAVVLIPVAPMPRQEREYDADFRRSMRSSPAQAMSDARRRFQALDRRLARLEKYVTSSRYSLDHEFRNLDR
ncbi:MAG: PspC domain-containing protein [Woeseiaceae bacterium]|jgi:phage shock protein C|nr:PspC domain-containing protein [Woeseiaceae bacterium]